MNKFAILGSALLVGVCLGVVANEEKPSGKIVTPDDARMHGLEDLRKAKKDIKGPGLGKFLKPGKQSRKALVQLGKALFWDQQLGSGGKAGKPGQACASCHFHAGADSRIRNQLSPDLLRVADDPDGDIVGLHTATKNPDSTFQTRQPGQKLRFADFPFVRDVNNPGSPNNSNDVASSMGVLRTEFRRVVPGKAHDRCRDFDDAVFQTVHGTQVRRVEPRNTPTVLNAFLTSFFALWDGRANAFFNGANIWGGQEPNARILVFDGTDIVKERIAVEKSALASQALGPPISDFEMSCGVLEELNIRTRPEIGKKLLRKNNGQRMVPLAQQRVPKDDSVLGALSADPDLGLTTNYSRLVKKAFRKKYWKAPGLRVEYIGVNVQEVQPGQPLVALEPRIVAATPEEIALETPWEEPVIEAAPDVEASPPLTEAPAGQRFNIMEANIALFFGLAVQRYEQRLITDNTWFDRWMRDGKFNGGFGKDERTGLNTFVNKGRCVNCHGGPELTNASVRKAQPGSNGQPDNIIEPKRMHQGMAIHDTGFYNTSVTPAFEDRGRGITGPTGAPISSSRQRLFAENKIGSIPFTILGGDSIPAVSEEGDEVCNDTDGNGFCGFDEPLLGPFQRVAVDGAMKTPGLRQVNETGPYWHNGAAATLRQVVEFYDNGGNFCQPNIDNLDSDIGPLGLSSKAKRNLVKFLISLSDRRVVLEKAPFDHPSLRIARNGKRNGTVIDIPAVGRKGREPLGLPPLGTFLRLNQQKIGNAPVNANCMPNVEP